MFKSKLVKRRMETLKTLIMSLKVKIHQVLELDSVDISNFLWMIILKYLKTVLTYILILLKPVSKMTIVKQ